MDFDNDKYQETSNLIIIANMMKIIKIPCSFSVRVCVCVCGKHSNGQFNKNMICSPVHACAYVGKVYRINMSIISLSKKDKNWLYLHTCWLVSWLVGFNGITTSKGYLIPEPFLYIYYIYEYIYYIYILYIFIHILYIKMQIFSLRDGWVLWQINLLRAIGCQILICMCVYI